MEGFSHKLGLLTRTIFQRLAALHTQVAPLSVSSSVRVGLPWHLTCFIGLRTISTLRMHLPTIHDGV